MNCSSCKNLIKRKYLSLVYRKLGITFPRLFVNKIVWLVFLNRGIRFIHNQLIKSHALCLFFFGFFSLYGINVLSFVVYSYNTIALNHDPIVWKKNFPFCGNFVLEPRDLEWKKIEVRSNGFQIKSAQHHNVNYYSELMISNFPD